MNEGSRPAVAPESLGPTITIGEILVEIMADTTGDGFLETQQFSGPYPSGAPAIFIDQVAKAGGSAGMIATVGTDDFGRVNLNRLAHDGVDISAISMTRDLPTGTAFVRYRADGGRDFVFNIAKSAAGDIRLDDASQALIGRAGHLHLMGTALTIPKAWPVIEFAIAAIKLRGGTLSFDPNVRKELMDDAGLSERFSNILRLTDSLLPSGEELFAANPAQTEAEAVAGLLGLGIREVVLKRGSHGTSHFSRTGRIDCAALLVKEVDPTGAGDSFGGAYIALRRLGFAVEAALRYANTAGARAVTLRGPMEGTSTLVELDAFMTATGAN
jgi:hypothetical protein